MNTVDAPLEVHARERGDRPAVITPAGRISYRELYRRVRAAADTLEAAGIERHDRVGLFMEDRLDLLILIQALFHRGAIAAPLSTRTPIGRLAELLTRIDGRCLITDRDAVRRRVKNTVHSDPLMTRRPETADGPTSFNLDAPATIVFTSGSSGRPKPVLHSHGNHYFSARGSNENISLTPRDRWLLSLPLYHVSGLAIVFRSLIAGAAVVIPDPNAPLSQSLSAYRATHVSLVATQLRKLLADASAPFEHVRAILLGGGSIPDTLIDEAYDRNLPIHVSYGLTEMSSQVTTTPPEPTRQQLHTSGKLLPYRELDIAQDGEILVRGPTLFQGYIDEQSLDPQRDADDWYHTGDIGRIDTDGNLHVLGRKDNMFVSGGENIHPEEIESALEHLPSVDEAVVVPVCDEEFGFRPVAFIRWESVSRPLDELREQLTSSLARFKLPVAVLAWPEDASSAGLKLDRDRLQGIAEERLDR